MNQPSLSSPHSSGEAAHLHRYQRLRTPRTGDVVIVLRAPDRPGTLRAGGEPLIPLGPVPCSSVQSHQPAGTPVRLIDWSSRLTLVLPDGCTESLTYDGRALSRVAP